MKKLLKKVLSVAAATALLMTSVISATATSAASDKYTITITGSGDGDITDEKQYPSTLYAFQIFSGTVPDKQPDQNDPVVNPGTENATLQLTDIKWGSGIDTSKLSSFIVGLSKHGVIGNYFQKFVDTDHLKDDYNVSPYNRLAVEVAEILQDDFKDNRQYMQFFADMLGGYYANPSQKVATTPLNTDSSGYAVAEKMYLVLR